MARANEDRRQRAANKRLGQDYRLVEESAVRLTSELKRVNAEKKLLKDQNEQLRRTVAASENLVELNRLRVEVSSLHRQIDGYQKQSVANEAEIKEAHNARMAAERRGNRMEETLETMQRARDAAQGRESDAYRKLALVERDLGHTKTELAELEARAEQLCDQVNAINLAHSKGHPEPVAKCAICEALDRKPSSAAAATDEKKAQ